MFTTEEYAAIESNKAFFLTVPWVAKHIISSGWTAFPTRSREPKDSTEDSFFAMTLKSPNTILHCLSLCLAPELPIPQTSLATLQTVLPIPIAKTIVSLGEGLAGYPRIAHGGLLGTLLDEQMGILLTANQEYASSKGNISITQMTVSMTVRYKRPIKLPSIVVVEAKATKKEGKRLVIMARLLGEKGVCVEAEGLWVDVPSSRL